MATLRMIAAAAVCTWLVACATAGEGVGETDNLSEGAGAPSGGGDGGAGGESTTTTASMTTTTSGEGGEGGSGIECDAPGHMCGGICVGNTPGTGCYQSVSCSACPTPQNGTAICAMDGTCSAQCTSPYVLNGSTCTCPTQCCSNADCGGDPCQNGVCVPPPSCDQVQCTALCLIQGMLGICLNNVCNCVPV